jgi:hypothetical protein
VQQSECMYISNLVLKCPNKQCREFLIQTNQPCVIFFVMTLKTEFHNFESRFIWKAEADKNIIGWFFLLKKNFFQVTKGGNYCTVNLNYMEASSPSSVPVVIIPTINCHKWNGQKI